MWPGDVTHQSGFLTRGFALHGVLGGWGFTQFVLKTNFYGSISLQGIFRPHGPVTFTLAINLMSKFKLISK